LSEHVSAGRSRAGEFSSPASSSPAGAAAALPRALEADGGGSITLLG
jgi:hypothetical protein